MPVGLAGFDKRALQGAPFLVGIDEAGRGCLAGPVVAAAVRCEVGFYQSSWCRRNSRGVDDSKRLSPARRAEIVLRFAKACSEKRLQIGIGTASVGEIERYNIYHANTLAMRRALEQAGWDPGAEGGLWSSCEVPRGRILIDGKPIRNFPYPHEAVVKGDQRSLAIALAGIHAKEWRDALMRELDREHPGYGFAEHKGYGTVQHLEALQRLGPCPQHRPSFLRRILGGDKPDGKASQCSLFSDEGIH